MSPRRRRRPAGPPALLIDRLIRSYDAWLGLAAQAGFWTDAQGRLATQILNDWRAITQQLAQGRYSRASVEEAVAACGRQDLLDRAFLSDILVGVRPELPPFVWLGDW